MSTNKEGLPLMNPSRNNSFSRDDVLNMVSVVNELIDGSGQLFNQYNNEPAINSQAALEQKNFPKPDSVVDVHCRGILSMEAAGDHLMGFVACLVEPAKTLAPATCVRGLLESCALAAWFLDPAIDAKTRVGRCFAFRYEGFVQQIKCSQVANRTTEINRSRQRIIKVEQEAVALGYPRLLNKIDNRCFIFP